MDAGASTVGQEGEVPSSAAPVPQNARPQRVLACILCQQRKIKCDRKFPCSNCTRSRAQCVPAALAPRRRRRRFPERDLLARLRTYEDLLRQHNIHFEPLHHDPAEDKGSPNVHIDYASDNEQTSATSVPLLAPLISSPSEKVYAAKTVWQAMNQGFREADNDSDSSPDDVQESLVKEAWDRTYEHSDHLIFGSQKPFADLSTLQPETVHIFRLWQIYLDNVNPLLKVTHTPSLQGRIIEGASNIANLGNNLEALMFSIYCMSILSLAPEDCQAIFASSKRDLLRKFQFGCEQALLKCEFLKTSNRDCLTALYLYLVSIRSTTDPRSMSSMLGIAIRIAQRMGIHSEASNCTYSTLEAEMRRRLWWSMVLFDARSAELADYRAATLLPTWDCKTPLNVNDSELLPKMKSPLSNQSRPSEALLVVVRSEMGECIRYTDFHLDFTNPALKLLGKIKQHDSSAVKSELDELEQSMQEKYLQYCDEENPLHFMTIWTVRGYLARCRLMEFYSQCSNPAAQPTEAQRDAALGFALTMLRCDTNIMNSPLIKGYLWVTSFNFPFLAYMQIVQVLRRRPTSEQNDQAWETMSENYESRFTTLYEDHSPLFQMFAKMILAAWEAREVAFKPTGKPLQPSRIVSNIIQTLSKGASDSVGSPPKNTQAIYEITADLGMSMPMDLGGQSLPNQLGELFAYTAPFPLSGRNMSAETSSDISMNQLNWSFVDWGLSKTPGW